MLDTILFYLFAAGAILFGCGVITSRLAVYSVLSLVGAMCALSGLFVLLKAYLVATVLILVYAGAILVLFLFIVMLIDFRKLSLDWRGLSLGTVTSLFIVGTFVWQTSRIASLFPLQSLKALDGTAQPLGHLLFSRYLIAFELTSFLLLAAVVSVVVLAKKGAA